MAVLKNLNLTNNEIKAYDTILSLGVCEPKDVCHRTHIPTSKIYNIFLKLEKFGLIEIQQSRPKKIRVLNPTLTYDKINNLKKEEYENFKKELLQFKSYLEKRRVNAGNQTTFWNVAISESQILKRHLSRFNFVEKLAYICIDNALLRFLSRSKINARYIYDNFKAKKINYKLIVEYQPFEKKEIIDWLETRPENPNPQGDIRLLKQNNNSNKQIFGIFDYDKIMLFYKDPVDPQKFLTSIFMTNKEQYSKLYSLFMDLWEKSYPIG